MTVKYDTKRTLHYTVVRQGTKPPSSTWSDIECPFCGTVSRAYHWSLYGGGKKCEGCGAKFDAYENAAPLVAKKAVKK